jgi:hypothetical protein
MERLFSIDTEQDVVAELGLSDIDSFDVDSKGNIYIHNRQSGEDGFYKFNNLGEFLLSFGKRGQGPGEIQTVMHLFITDQDEVAVTNAGNNRLTIFNEDGTLKEEIRINSDMIACCPLPNGNYLLYENVVDPASDYLMQNPLGVSDAEFDSFVELDRQMVPNPMQGERLKGTYHIFSWAVSRDRIFTGFQERGYEIYIYDFDGNMRRKIKKEYAPVPVPQWHKDEFNEAFSNPIFDDIRNKIYFPANMPAFISFTVDEAGRLFVMTYEEGENPIEFLFDIFNGDGIFVGRKSLRAYHNDLGYHAKFRNNRFHSLIEKESGYMELVVYEMYWE